MNPLSYKIGTKFSGQMLNNWLSDQITNHGSHKRIAQKINKHFIFRSDRVYQLVQMPYRTNDKLNLGFIQINI